MNTKTNKNRYSGLDVNNWKVVTYAGEEMVLPKTVIDEVTGNRKEILVTRWNGFKTANSAALRLGGVAVRA